MDRKPVLDPSRRAMLLSLAALPVLAAAVSPANVATAPTAEPSARSYRERYVNRDGHRIYVRDYPGKGPAYVMVHGFPDNSGIYDDIATRLSERGHRVIAFDFLGFGASDKPDGFKYDFDQQLADLTAVVDDLGDAQIIPVGHDAGGPAAINFALDNPSRVSSLVLFNAYYANSPVLAFPDFIELCCNPKTRLLAEAMMTDPQQAGYLFKFQQEPIRAHLTPAMRQRFDTVLQPLIERNFTASPSAMPALLAMTGNAYENLAANDLRLPELGAFDKPVKLIWGRWDRYLNLAVAKDIASRFPNASVISLDAEHWPQFDQPDQAVEALLRKS